MYVHFSSSFSNPLMVTNVNKSYTCTTNNPISINSTFSDKKANTEAHKQTHQYLEAFFADPDTPANTTTPKPTPDPTTKPTTKPTTNPFL